MKIQNETHWRTDQIRPLLQRAAEMELEPKHRRKVKVVVSYRRRGGGSSGCAYLKSNWCKVRVSSDIFDVLDFVIVACHEFAHCRGMQHRHMPSYYLRGSDKQHERYAWAKDPALKVERVVVVKPSALSLAERAHMHAVRMGKLAESRLKRARTIQKKWARKEHYYETRLAAMHAPKVP